MSELLLLYKQLPVLARCAECRRQAITPGLLCRYVLLCLEQEYRTAAECVQK